MDRLLVPLTTKPTTSVASIRDDWYVVCEESALRSKPIARTLLGTPIVVFRDSRGEVGALLDRCPHRNVPLSLGRVEGEDLQCGYHGWRFNREGRCTGVPGLCGSASDKARRVESFATRVHAGFVWVYATPDEEPVREAYVVPHASDRRYTTIRHVVDFEGTVHATAENALDVPHTAFLHKGLFRGDADRNEIEVVVTRHHDRVEAQYIGEPRPEGLIGKLLSPSGGTVEHFDRFMLPSIAQVEYRLGAESHVVATTMLTPVEDHLTRMFASVSFRMPIPGGLIASALKPLALRIVKQDVAMLKRQTETVKRFGGERYHSTEIDALGPAIGKLMRQAERGEREPLDEPKVRRFKMMV